MKTTVKTPWGVYFFKRLAMGLSNSRPSERLVEHNLDGLESVFVYLDNIMASSDKAGHDLKLEAVLKRLEDAGLSVQISKQKN